MGHNSGRTAVRRVFWPCLVVLVDFRIQGFDVLFDPVGYLMLASAGMRLAKQERSFYLVWACSLVSAVFAVADAGPVVPIVGIGRFGRDVDLSRHHEHVVDLFR